MLPPICSMHVDTIIIKYIKLYNDDMSYSKITFFKMSLPFVL